MLTLLSPAKNLNEAPIELSVPTTSPAFQKDAAKLARIAKTKTAQDLKDLMHISDNLAELNVDRFQSFVLNGQSNSAKPAMLTFNGDVYGGLNAETLDDEGLEFAQDHVRILSGLYGLLRPLDVMQPYRLEMGIKFENDAGKDLYAFWKNTIAPALNRQSEAQNSDTIINLASNEYFLRVFWKKKMAKPACFLSMPNGRAGLWRAILLTVVLTGRTAYMTLILKAMPMISLQVSPAHPSFHARNRRLKMLNNA